MGNAPDSLDRRAVLQNALAALDKMKVRLDASERYRREPIAVIGLGCRFPGGASNSLEYWTLLHAGNTGVCEIPSERWDVDALYDPDPKAPGKMHTRYGGFLDQVDRFDARFFGISPRESISLDPQQRLLLEVTWEALEHAGIPADGLVGSNMGVFVGITTSDYAKRINFAEPQHSDVYAATGNALNAAAGRISFVLGLQGPCMAIDTACSSSLVAVHQACQSLRNGESSIAMAAGVNVILSPDPFILFSKWGMLAADGRCKAFDAGADGFVRGEGCGVVILKRLSDALADGDRVLALVRGSAVNQDGRSSGLTVPNGPAQQAVIRKALECAGVEAAQVSYVEAHGTGTSIGDPIEVEALAAVYGQGRDERQPLQIGSVKTNLGHIEAASGIAGLIKVILCLEHHELTPHLHLKEPNPRIPWDSIPVIVPTDLRPWPGINGRRIAGVSSFGFSGTNAHVVVEEAPPGISQNIERPCVRPLHILALSAQNEETLQTIAGHYARCIEMHPEIPVLDLCHTANAGRSHFRHRLAVVGENANSLRDQLNKKLHDKSADAGSSLDVMENPRIAFLFTGQGSQYAGMGLQLYQTQPTFRKILDYCGDLLRPHLAIPLLDVLYPKSGESTPLDNTAYSQPALFCLEVALAELLKSWGIVPGVVMGHSVGEYAAACVAGLFSLEDGLKLIAERGRLMQALPAGGQMISVMATEQIVADTIRGFEDEVAIAVINGPDSVVISGTANALAQVSAKLKTAGVKMQQLVVSHAFHSPLMEPMLDDFRTVAGTVQYLKPKIEMISNVTGEVSKTHESKEWADYWVRHVRMPVQFEKSMKTLAGQNCRVFMELGPSPVLLGMGRLCLPDSNAEWLPSLRKGTGDWLQLLDTVARLYVKGASIDWKGFDREHACSKVSLPTYPFQRQRYWLDDTHSPLADTQAAICKGKSRHPLLGRPLELPFAPDTHVWLSVISTSQFPFLRDHQVQNTVIVPASFYSEIALEAAAEIWGDGPKSLSEVQNIRPIMLGEGSEYALQIILTERETKRLAFSVFGRQMGSTDGTWTLHVTADMSHAQEPADGLLPLSKEQILARCPKQISGQDFYSIQAKKGNQWGPCFNGVHRIWIGSGEAISQVVLPVALRGEADKYQFHPAWSDSGGHVLTATILEEETHSSRLGAFVGGGIDETCFYRHPRGTELWAHARLRDGEGRENILTGDVRLFDDDGLIAEVIGAHLWYLDSDELAAGDRVEKWFLRPEWRPNLRMESAETSSVGGSWLILADNGGMALALKRILEESGKKCVLAFADVQFARTGDGQFRIRPGVADDFKTLLEEAQARRWEGVLQLWGLDAPPCTTVASLKVASQLGCVAAMHLVQQLSLLGQSSKMWIVTRGAQKVIADDKLQNLSAATLWGWGRTLALEHSEFWGGIVDLDPDVGYEESAKRLAMELLAPSGEDHLAYRGDQRFVARLMPHELAAGGVFRCRSDGTYLITGGLGGLGLTVARWLVEKGARRLILMGRTPLPPRAQWKEASGRQSKRIAEIQKLESLGAHVQLASVDVGEETQMRSFFEGYAKEGWPPIRGIIHAAGIMQYEPLLQHTVAAMSAVLKPKVEGAWLLHQLSKDLSLDFFVLFSSASSLLSSPLLSSYAAANSFLDSLAHYRRGIGLPALSINWGLWSGVGMGADFEKQERSTSGLRGMGTISPEQGVEALGRLLLQDAAQVGVIPINWNAWMQLYPALAASPFLSGLVAADTASGNQHARSGKNAALLETDPERRREVILAWLSEQITSVLRLPAGSLDATEPINRMGLDSLMAVELKNRIEVDLGVIIPMVKFLQGPSAAMLADQILDDLAHSETNKEEVEGVVLRSDIAAESPETLLARLPELSDKEVEHLLTTMMSKARE